MDIQEEGGMSKARASIFGYIDHDMLSAEKAIKEGRHKGEILSGTYQDALDEA